MPTPYLDYEFRDSPEFVSTYDELPLWSAPFGLALLKNIELKPNQTVLDLSSGTGFLLFELAERLGESCKVFGLDPWTNANRRVREKIESYDVPNAEIVEGVGETMPFDSSRFDLIVSNLGLNNWQNPDQVLTECFRVLKADGKLVLTTNLFGHWKEFYQVFERTLTELGKPDLVAKLKHQEEHRATPESLASRLQHNSFQITRQVTDKFEMRFLDGSSFLRHHFIKLGFVGEWKEFVPPAERQAIFNVLETNLNRLAAEQGCLELTVPLAHVEANKV